MDVNNIIAANLKQLRTDRNLSIRQLAELSGVSNVMLAQIEKGESNPTINTLLKITTALKVPYTRLIDEVTRNVTLVSKDERVALLDAGDKYKIFNYFPFSTQRNFEFFYVELEPYSQSTSDGHSEKAQEYVFVISGKLGLKINEKLVKLKQEDALYFESAVKHTYINDTGQKVRFISINYYP